VRSILPLRFSTLAAFPWSYSLLAPSAWTHFLDNKPKSGTGSQHCATVLLVHVLSNREQARLWELLRRPFRIWSRQYALSMLELYMRSDAGNSATCLLSDAAADEMDSLICTLTLGIPYSGEMFVARIELHLLWNYYSWAEPMLVHQSYTAYIRLCRCGQTR